MLQLVRCAAAGKDSLRKFFIVRIVVIYMADSYAIVVEEVGFS